MGASHADQPTEDPDRLRPLPRHHPSAATHAVAALESRDAGKLARPVRGEVARKRPTQEAPRRAAYSTPKLQAAIAARMAGRDRRPDHLDRVHDRGVITERSIWVVPADGIDWPHAAQVFLLRREVLDVCQARISREFVFGITSRPAERIDPAGLNTAVRGHWGIENSEHLVRDVTFGEDAHQAYIGAAPQVMATLRNLAMSVIRLAGSNEIKRTLQRIRRDRTRALHLIGLS